MRVGRCNGAAVRMRMTPRCVLTVWTLLLPALLDVVLPPADRVVVLHLPSQTTHDLLDINLPVDVVLDDQRALDVVVDDIAPDVRVCAPDSEGGGVLHVVVAYVAGHGFRVHFVDFDLCASDQRRFKVSFLGRMHNL